MKTLRFGTRFVVATLLLGLAGGVLFWAVQAYQRESRTDLTAQGARKETPSNPRLAQELEQAMGQPKVQPSRYRVIEDRNLFTPERKMWSPPEPEKKDDEKTEIVEAQRTDVQLFGTFRMNDTRYAILGLPLLRRAYPRYTVAEGETLTSEDAENSPEPVSYTLVAIEDDHILVRDYAGKTFKVSHENKRNGPSFSTAAASSPSVVVTSQAAPPASAARSTPQTNTGPGVVTTEKGDRAKPGLVSKEKREQMVRDGSMVKVKTPFGTMYKYTN